MTGDERQGDERQGDERAASGVEHLQAAALEMIEAARAFLDVAEDFVADPEKVADTVSALGSLARVVARESGVATRPGRRSERDPGPDGPDHRGSGGAGETDRVEHITVS